MPLYEYQCDACGHRFELIKKFSDPPVKVCPECGSAVHKLQSAPAFQFKGTGWYVTDYGKGGPPDTGKPAAKEAKKTPEAAKSDTSSSSLNSSSETSGGSSSTSTSATDSKKSSD